MALHLYPAYRRKRPSDTGKYHPQIIVDFSCRGNRGARVPRIDLLLYRDCRRNPLYGLHVRLAHPAEKLPRIRGQTLRKTPLPLREQCVEGQ